MRCRHAVVIGKRCLFAAVAALIVLGTFAAASPRVRP